MKYSKLHEERAMLLKELYIEIYKMEKDLFYFTSIYQGDKWFEDEERRDTALKQLIKCRQLFESNRIYLPQSFCDKLDTNIDTNREVINSMQFAQITEKIQECDQKQGREFRFKKGETPGEMWNESANKVKLEIQKNRIELAESFRKLLGVNEE